MEIMKYKDYEGTATIDTERQLCVGKLLFIDDLVTYEAPSPAELYFAFCEAVDDYIQTCKEIGKKPEKAIKGAFNVRISPDMHRKAIRKSIQLGVSLNEIIVRALNLYLNGQSNVNHVTNLIVQQGTPQFRTLDVTASASLPKWSKLNSSILGVRSGN